MTPLNKGQFLLGKLQITPELQTQIHQATIGQRQNPTWLLLRKGRLTASNFGVVLNSQRITQSLVNRLVTHNDLSKVKAINWGVTNENEGLKVFTEVYKLPIQESGLWLTLCGTLGASPDGLVGDNAIVEVKCPYTHRNVEIVEIVEKQSNFYIEKLENGSYTLKKNHNYWHQIQGQLHLTGRQLCYFVVWTTQQAMILEIEKDPDWSENLQKLKTFYVDHILPKVIS